jgi:hypothetical protein
VFLALTRRILKRRFACPFDGLRILAAWYYRFILYFVFSLAEQKEIQKKKYRCEQALVGSIDIRQKIETAPCITKS